MSYYIQELYTDKTVQLGVVFRVYFHALYVYPDRKVWHYFGSVPKDYPPTSTDPVFTHTYVQLPDDMLFAGPDLKDLLFELGTKLGAKREQL